MKRICERCQRTSGGIMSGYPESSFSRIKGVDYCPDCARSIFKKSIDPILITTTLSFDGYKIEKYIDIESVEIVMGTGIFSEFSGEISDFLGERSSGFEVKLQKAKSAALSRLKYLAFEKGGDGVVGVDLDYTEFSGNRIGVIANGTIVKLSKIEE